MGSTLGTFEFAVAIAGVSVRARAVSVSPSVSRGGSKLVTALGPRYFLAAASYARAASSSVGKVPR